MSDIVNPSHGNILPIKRDLKKQNIELGLLIEVLQNQVLALSKYTVANTVYASIIKVGCVLSREGVLVSQTDIVDFIAEIGVPHNKTEMLVRNIMNHISKEHYSQLNEFGKPVIG